MGGLTQQAAHDFARFYERREELRWALGDICALAERGSQGLARLSSQLAEQHGISITATALQNYARVANAFPEHERHLQYKWSNFLEWSRWRDPIAAMKTALDNCYSPTQMSKLRLHDDPEYKKPTIERCEICGGDLLYCEHGHSKGLSGLTVHVEQGEDLGVLGRDETHVMPADYQGLDPFAGLEWQQDDEGEAGRMVQRDQESQSAKEDRR